MNACRRTRSHSTSAVAANYLSAWWKQLTRHRWKCWHLEQLLLDMLTAVTVIIKLKGVVKWNIRQMLPTDIRQIGSSIGADLPLVTGPDPVADTEKDAEDPRHPLAADGFVGYGGLRGYRQCCGI